MVMKIANNSFAGNARLHGPNGLGAAMRGMLISQARIHLMVAAIVDLVDNTTGVAANPAVIPDLAAPTPFDATAAGGATRTAFNAALNKIEDANKVLVNSMNAARSKLGLTSLTAATGAQAAANTLPALDKTVATTNGATAVAFPSASALILAEKNNIRILANAMNEMLSAIGETEITIALSGRFSNDVALAALGDAAASGTGSNALSKAAADAFLTWAANSYATMAARWNAAMVQGSDVRPLSVIAGR